MHVIHINELSLRWKRCQSLLKKYIPEAGGVLVTSRTNIYYFSGTCANGLMWIPVEGEPVLLCRKGVERAELESPVKKILSFKNYGELTEILKREGSPLSDEIAVGMNGLPWSLGLNLSNKLSHLKMIAGDNIIAMTRSVKSEWEIAKIRVAGERHNKCLHQYLPGLLHERISEKKVAHELWKLFFEHGHNGLSRMDNFAEEVFLGHIAIGESANYPSVFNGPVGLRGLNPAVPCMGSADVIWQKKSPLTCDVVFVHEGYMTDKTQIYWLGGVESIPDHVFLAHEFCIKVQTWLAEHLKPGTIPSELWNHCLAWAQEEGWEEGFMALGGNKVHFLGHGIGLAIDEYPAIAKGFDLPLQHGMVLALEPKIGIKGVGMVGVENTFVVNPDGGESVTGNEFDIIPVKVG